MAQVQDIGIDLGTSSVVIYGKGQGVLLNEPGIIAVNRETRAIIAVGGDARRMVGRTPGNILAVRPLRDGIITDYELTSAMLRLFVSRVVGKRLIGGPRVVISVPSGVNEVERRSILTSLFEAGARRTQVLERPVAAALGAGLLIGEAYGEMICDIGAGMTDIAVMSLGRCMVRDNVKTGGDLFDEAIIKYIRRKHNLLIGEITAEDLKINIGSAMPRTEQLYMEVTGRNLITGLPKLMRITSDEITEALEEPVQALVESIHAVLEHTPAELAADVFESGITLSGGGAQLAGLCEAVSTAMKVHCRLADNPQECVARGCGLTLENYREYGKYIGDRHAKKRR